jgi:hypothetical protein
MDDKYGCILAELLRLNATLQSKCLKKRGKDATFSEGAKKACNRELRIYNNPRAKAFAGMLWYRIRKLNVDTRCIYQLLLQWALHLTELGLLGFYTSEYEELHNTIRNSIESGVAGEFEDISPAEIEAEWELMQIYLTSLHGMVEQWK